MDADGLGWSGFEPLGNLIVYPRTPPEEILDRIKEADVILTNKTELKGDIINNAPQLKYIGILATGVNVVDIEAAKECGIIVTNVRNYNGLSAPQMVFALLLELTNRVGHHSDSVFKGDWSTSEDFSYWHYPLVELDGLNFGIVGYGGIGKAVAKVAQAFGMSVLVQSRSKPKDLPEDIKFCDLDSLAQESDVISLHCPLTDQTKHVVDSGFLRKMKSTAFLINIGRGGLIVERDLTDALNNDEIAGAALDVLEKEPADPTCPLLKAKNCYITPHISWATAAARKRLMKIALDNLKAFLSGQPQNQV